MRCIALLLLTACSGAPSPSAHVHDRHKPEGHKMHGPDGAKHRFGDVDKWSKIFDAPERDAWQKPAELVAALQIPAGSTVADLGAGTGYLTAHLATAVGEDGHVFALEVEPSLAAHLISRFAETKQVQVQTIGFDDAGLTADSVDFVVMLDVYHHIEGRTEYFSKVRPALRAGGKLVVVDFKEGELPVGPPPAHKIPPKQVNKELAEAGYTLESTLDLLPHQFVHIYSAAQ